MRKTKIPSAPSFTRGWYAEPKATQVFGSEREQAGFGHSFLPRSAAAVYFQSFKQAAGGGNRAGR
jgi:hypothetical protein